MNGSKEDYNVEHKVLICASHTLLTGFRSAHTSLCRAFVSKELLHRQVLRLGNADNVNRETSLQEMVTALQDRVEIDPKAYYTIIEVLKEEGCLSYLAVKLEGLMRVEEEKLAEKKFQKMVESQRQLHQVTSGLGLVNIHSLIDLPPSKEETTYHLRKKTEARNATAFGPAKSGEIASMIHPFVSQAQVICTEGEDTLVSSSPENNRSDSSTAVAKLMQSQDVEKGFRKPNIVMGIEDKTMKFGTFPANESHEDLMATPTDFAAMESGGNKVLQSTGIGGSNSQGHFSEQEMETHIEVEHDGGGQQNEEDKEESLRKTWMTREDVHRYPSKSRILTERNIHEQSTSDCSDNSELHTTPPRRWSNPPSSPEGRAHIKRQFFTSKQNELEVGKETLELFQAQTDGYQMQLNEKEQDRVGMCGLTMYEEMVSKMNSLIEQNSMSRRRALNSEYDRRERETREHRKQIQKLEREVQMLKKKVDRAYREKELAEKERDEIAKERDEMKERDLAEMERVERLARRFAEENHQIRSEEKQAKVDLAKFLKDWVAGEQWRPSPALPTSSSVGCSFQHSACTNTSNLHQALAQKSSSINTLNASDDKP